MTCYRPNRVQNVGIKENGRMDISWKWKSGAGVPQAVPCSKCVGCRLEHSRQWSDRCMCEASLHEENCFITLTFNSKNLPENRSLDKRHFQLFMKRLRKMYYEMYGEYGRIKYFHCGEYGGKLGRPHYHAILFGVDFNDKVLVSVRNGNKLYKSECLSALWPYGYSSIGSVTYQSAAYVARYSLKKVSATDLDHYVDKFSGEVLAPEYVTMSRRPAIAARWLDKFFSDVYPSDEMVSNGRVNRPSRFFDRQLEKLDPNLYDEVKAKRLEYRRNFIDSTDERLKIREQVKLAQISTLKREMR